MKSVPKTNVISDRDFGQLDHLMREKPNASILSLEAIVLFSNKTGQWLNKKPEGEIKDLLQKAWSVAPEFKKYEERREQMFEERAQLLKAKEQALQAAKEKSLNEERACKRYQIARLEIAQSAQSRARGGV